ncbi:MAG: alanine racemase [Planctomycetes bacterium]|nr:alanine racemase [Planctomycetota bacterium]
MKHYRAWAEIDLDALTHNLAVIRRRAGSGVGVMLVVKADAYGHGAVAVAHHAVRCGIDSLGVGTSAEALELREAGVRAPILVLGTLVDEEAASTLRHRIEIGIHSSDRVTMLERLARNLGVRARVHLNIDTGMGRLGVLPESALRLFGEIHAARHLELVGVMTHISAARGALDDATHEQVRRFQAVLDQARDRGLLRGRVHLANSASLFTGLAPLHELVRPGISAYGILPGGLPGAAELQPVMSLTTQVVFLKDVPAGTTVGYDSTWSAPRATRLATLPVGYNDGVAWRLGNRGVVLVRGQRAPIVGRVSMDYTTVDVGHVRGVEVGDTVTLFGRAGGEQLALEEVAREAATIPYELTCSVGKRVKRVYVGGEALPLPSQPAPPTRAVPQPDEPRPHRTEVAG